ncbi:MAG TPA: CbtA family protein [Amycolatopsis sp.]|jgi:hypothetical protein|nr:CbtA family protein [Amycolatopsis sp.]
MLRTLLIRGMLAGLAAGVVASVFAYLFGEGPVDDAIGFEAAMSHHDEPELVSRGVQSTAGLLVAVSAYAIAIGGLFALVFALSLGRIGTLSARGRAAAVAALGFVVVVLVPFLKYPANPPAVGVGGTIGERTELYFGFLAISLLAAAVAVFAWTKLRTSLDSFAAATISGGGYLVLVAVAAWLMPAIDEVPDGFSASLLWTFRLSSLGTQAVLWTCLGLVFGVLARSPLGEKRRAMAFV